MRAYVLQHVPFEELGNIRHWLEQQQAEIHYCRLYADDPFPSVSDIDLLIVLGGPMSVNDESHYPWLKAEKAFLTEVIAADKPVVGICLGAQLIACTQGGRVYSNYTKEIGWFDIHALPVAGDVLALPATMNVFHWHGETFTLPPGAHHLARSAACNHQAFQLAGKAVIGLQFHLETTPESLRGMVQHCGEELQVSDTIQSAESLLASPPEAFVTVNQLMARLLQYLTTHQSG